jgi:GH24 family phage-related lysozyme (muramidase)
MSNASDICAARIIRYNEEGFRADVYDDATGELIVCKGQPTVGYGCRVRQWSRKLARGVLSLQLEEFEEPLLDEPWYVGCNDVRRSALLEIAMNQGDDGLEDGYPELVAAVKSGNWARAQAQCTVKEDAVKPRYARIGRILASGVDAP